MPRVGAEGGEEDWGRGGEGGGGGAGGLGEGGGGGGTPGGRGRCLSEGEGRTVAPPYGPPRGVPTPLPLSVSRATCPFPLNRHVMAQRCDPSPLSGQYARPRALRAARADRHPEPRPQCVCCICQGANSPCANMPTQSKGCAGRCGPRPPLCPRCVRLPGAMASVRGMTRRLGGLGPGTLKGVRRGSEGGMREEGGGGGSAISQFGSDARAAAGGCDLSLAPPPLPPPFSLSPSLSPSLSFSLPLSLPLRPAISVLSSPPSLHPFLTPFLPPSLPPSIHPSLTHSLPASLPPCLPAFRTPLSPALSLL